MDKYMLLRQGSTKPPSYIHNDIDLAIAEAKRLTTILGGEVLILKVVGVAKTVEVPVVRKEAKVEMFNTDDLPF